MGRLSGRSGAGWEEPGAGGPPSSGNSTNQSAKARAITTNSNNNPVYEIARHVTSRGEGAARRCGDAIRASPMEPDSSSPPVYESAPVGGEGVSPAVRAVLESSRVRRPGGRRDARPTAPRVSFRSARWVKSSGHSLRRISAFCILPSARGGFVGAFRIRKLDKQIIRA
jgi:hypothetical protein